MKVLAFGEILFDFIEGNFYLGGAPLNFVVHLKRLGAKSYLYSRLGNDALGKKALEELKRLHLDAAFVQQDGFHPTGTVNVFLNNGQPDYDILKKVAYDYIEYQEGRGMHDQIDVLYFGTLAQRNEVSRNSLKTLVRENNFKFIFCDINLRKDFFSKEMLHTSMELCDILKLNDDEVRVVSMLFYGRTLDFKEFCNIFSKAYHISQIIITAGGSGCYIFDQGKLNFIEGFKTNVMDTVGAGDSFSAAFLYFYFHGKGVLKAAEAANRLGAFVAGSRGAIPEYSLELKESLKL